METQLSGVHGASLISEFKRLYPQVFGLSETHLEKGDYPGAEREMGKLGYYVADVAHAKPTGLGGNSVGLILGCKRHCQMKGGCPRDIAVSGD